MPGLGTDAQGTGTRGSFFHQEGRMPVPHAQLVMPSDTQTLSCTAAAAQVTAPSCINISPITQLLISKHGPFKRLLHVCNRKITYQKAAKRNFQLSSLCKSSAVSKQAGRIRIPLGFSPGGYLPSAICTPTFAVALKKKLLRVRAARPEPSPEAGHPVQPRSRASRPAPS